MKTLSSLLLIASVTFAAAAQTVPLTFAWLPSASTNATYYRLYSTTNIAMPLSQWTYLTNVAAPTTNVTINAVIDNLTYVVTASFTNSAANVTNFIFEESAPSNPVWTTVIAGGKNLKISK